MVALSITKTSPGLNRNVGGEGCRCTILLPNAEMVHLGFIATAENNPNQIEGLAEVAIHKDTLDATGEGVSPHPIIIRDVVNIERDPAAIIFGGDKR